MDERKKYPVHCKICGKILFKTSFLVLIPGEIFCKDCKKIRKIPEEVELKIPERKRS